ncbi:uncharacterized protein EI97DRAFT_270942 [Westerdykella ornata]|uniref:SET domain-containing protein n=1 Tax=Westerdykella ornata TaxID=318751 RepID=A0A6A6JPV3_WESOR|nr:uncharacterized protein EI97DRAFT_270942 [Westerdykella ornata]KAF2277706.1 hypothetical protein EI97DRAFT_270942 [Westerdykella ornata]
MIALRPAGPSKGLGLFATTFIPKGTRILAEAPLLSLPVTAAIARDPPASRVGASASSPSEMATGTCAPAPSSTLRTRDAEVVPGASEVFTAFHTRLSLAQRSTFLELSGFPGRGVSWLGRWIEAGLWTLKHMNTATRRDWGETLAGKEEGIRKDKGRGMMLGFWKRHWESWGRNKRVLDVWRSNSFRLSTAVPPSLMGLGGKRSGGGEERADVNSGSGSAMKTQTHTQTDTQTQPQSSISISLFPHIARVNHACVPNAQVNWNPSPSPSHSSSPSSSPSPSLFPSPPPSSSSSKEQPLLTLHAIHPIPQGAEILISYLPETFALRAERQRKLREGYGFVCGCAAGEDVGGGNLGMGLEMEMMGGYAPDGSCDDWSASGHESSFMKEDEAEERREDAATLTQAESNSKKTDEDGIENMDARQEFKEEANTLLKEEIDLTLGLIRMLETQGISGREVASMYYRVARMMLDQRQQRQQEQQQGGNAEGNVGLAAQENKDENENENANRILDMAKRGLQLDRICLGEDHPVYRDARAWVEGLEKAEEQVR